MEFQPGVAASGGAQTGQNVKVRHHPWFDTSMSSTRRFL
jgi:hypothetical protein